MPITFNGGKGTSIDPNGFIKNQTTEQTGANFVIDGSGGFGRPFVDPNSSILNAQALVFIDTTDAIIGGQSGKFGFDYQNLSAQRLARLQIAANFVTGINRFLGRPYNFDVKVSGSIAPVDPTDLVRLEDLISGSIPGTPTIAAGAALGAGGTVQIFGNNFMGEIVLVMGAVPLANDTLCTITFGGGAAYLTASTPVISPAQAGTDKNAIALVGVLGNTNSWTISCNAVALDPITSYRFNYICGGVD